jgi:deoxycytidine triphosphate deaminase
MAKMITAEILKEMVEKGSVVQDGSVENCGPLKYDFVLSDDFLKADYGVPTKISELEPERRSEAVVSPGEVVYVLSKETVNLPKNMFLHLSANRGMSEYGILTLGGFAVDPGYTGRLMFGLYNYSSTSFKLIPGKKLVGAIFHELEDDESQGIDDYNPPKTIDGFPPRLVSIINQYSPTGLSTLEDSIKTINSQLELLQKDMTTHTYSIDEIRRLVKQAREDLEENNMIVKTLSNSVQQVNEGLDKEILLRQNMQSDLDKRITDSENAISKKLSFVKGTVWLATALGAGLLTLLITWLGGWLNF